MRAFREEVATRTVSGGTLRCAGVKAVGETSIVLTLTINIIFFYIFCTIMVIKKCIFLSLFFFPFKEGSRVL